MKRNLLIFFVLSFYFENSNAQAGEWVWLHGDSSSLTSNFGVQGVPSATNDPPTLYEACEWTDLTGNFWVYGGNGYADLWKYNPGTNEWTWMRGPGTQFYAGNYGIQGVSAPGNSPPNTLLGAISWIDNLGNLWLFGGSGLFNNLWRYSISTNEWTWMKGPGAVVQPGVYGTQGVPDPANNPPSRQEDAAGWTDNAGDLWLFGGQDGISGGGLNDLWRYSTASNTWTWMKGSSSINQAGVYGQQGIPNIANTPDARWVYCDWKDNAGNFWLFGGSGSSIPGGIHNDLWKFNPVTNTWTWINGPSGFNDAGNYGIPCTHSPTHVPGARMENRSAWKDASGNFWMYGGTSGPVPYMNDLWMYCMSANEWIWIGGDSLGNYFGNWGTRGVSSPSNWPSAKAGALGWSDNNGHLFLYGGYDNNAIWKYTIDTACTNCQSLLSANFSAPNEICPGTCTDFLNLSVYANTYEWSFPGGTPSTSTDVNPSGICYTAPGSYDVTLIAGNGITNDTLLLPGYITVYPQPAPQTILQSGDSLISNTGFAAYQWFYYGDTIAGATGYFYVASQSGDYSLISIDSNGCSSEAVVVNVTAGVSDFDILQSNFFLFPNPAGEKITFSMQPSTTGSSIEITIYNIPGEKVLSNSLTASKEEIRSIDVASLSSGMYILEVVCRSRIWRGRFVKE